MTEIQTDSTLVVNLADSVSAHSQDSLNLMTGTVIPMLNPSGDIAGGSYYYSLWDCRTQMHTACDTLSVTWDQIFGPLSTLSGTSGLDFAASIPGTFLTDNIVFKIVVLLCFGIYCVSLYLYRQQALTVLNIFRSKLYIDNLLSEHNYTFDSFLNIAISQVVFATGLATVKVIDVFFGSEIFGMIPQWGVPLLVLLVVAVFGLIFLFQTVALVSAGAMTFTMKFVSRLRYLRKMNLALFSQIFTPLLLVFSMAGTNAIIPVAVILAVGVAFVAVFYLVRSCMMFVDENISKLYWFLYLCTVEIFPVTFLVFFFRKLLS